MPKRNFKPGEIKLDASYMPHAHEAEGRVLGAILLEGQVEAEKSLIAVALMKGLCPESFHKHENRVVFIAMAEMYASNQLIDEVTVSEFLGEAAVEGGSNAFLQNLTNRVDTAKGFDNWLSLVSQAYAKRVIIMEAQRQVEIASAPQVQFEEMVKLLHDPIAKASAAMLPQNEETLDEVAERVRKSFRDEVEGKVESGLFLPSPLKELDRVFRPLRIGRDYSNIIAGSASSGKTTLMTQNMQYVLRNQPDSVVVDCQLENSKDNHVAQMASRAAQLDLQNINKATPEQIEKFEKYLDYIKELKAANRLFIFDGGMDIEDIIGRARYVRKKMGKITILGVDYIQLCGCSSAPDRSSATEIVTAISRKLKLLAQEVGAVGLFLSQLNRDQKREGRPPELYDLRQSGAIEQDADRVWMLDGHKVDQNTGYAAVDVYQRKFRNGRRDEMVTLALNTPTTTFYDAKK